MAALDRNELGFIEDLFQRALDGEFAELQGRDEEGLPNMLNRSIISHFMVNRFGIPVADADRLAGYLVERVKWEQDLIRMGEERVMSSELHSRTSKKAKALPARGSGKSHRTWIEALKLWNSSRSHWCIPKKGTKEYNQVYRLMKKKSA